MNKFSSAVNNSINEVMQLEVYIKPRKKAVLTGKRIVMLKDVAEYWSRNKNIGETAVFKIPENARETDFILSVIDIVSVLNRKYENLSVNLSGETETIIEYSPEKKEVNRFWNWTKLLFACAILFSGSVTAVMSFNSDAQIPVIFQNLYTVFTGEYNYKPYLLYIFYSIGLAVGIFGFYNHIAGKSLTKDPTPIEVQMSLYDKQVDDKVIETLDKEKIHADD